MSTPHPDLLAAFHDWRLAELASHYACDCPDEIMDDLIDRLGEALERAAAFSATCADDVLLKVFMLAVVELEPKNGQPPLLPADPTISERIRGHNSDVLWSAILTDITALSPVIAEAQLEPHRDTYRKGVAA